MGVLTALVVVLGAAVLVVPVVLLLGHARGLWVLREGGAGMLVLVALSLPVAGLIAAGGALAVRGRGGWAAALVAAPALPGVLATLFAMLAMKSSVHFFSGFDAGVEGIRLRILTVVLAETDSLRAYGAFLAAVACGASACGLLASAASVDRTQHRAPAGNAWAGPAVLGGLALIVMIAVRLVLRVGLGTLLVAAPSVLILTGLACAATVNAPLVRHWRDPRQADAWIASLVAAAFLAVAGFVVLDVGAALTSEGHALGAISVSGSPLDPSQRARILASLADEQSSYRALSIVDGIFGFLTVAVAALAGLGRAADGRLRFPRGAALYGALAASVLVVAVPVAARGWMLDGVERADTGPAATIELPRVPVTERLSPPTEGSLPVLHVDANGKSTLDGARAASRVLVVDADRRARWADVARAIKDARRSLRTTSIELRVTLLDKADRSKLAPYGALLGDETGAIRVALGDESVDAMRPRDHELMDGIAAALARRPTSFESRTTSAPDIAIVPPEGNW